ncbi:MAG: DNA-directed RNA polymerase subunit beta [Fibrobacteria bacterium]|nr:DNA-directed RNA polymerase subunit beta [Fibrobacteria bacterium]
MTERKSFAKSKYSMEIPFLLEVQVDSFNRFLQIGTLPKDRRSEGLESVFRETFPITDVKEQYQLVYEGYSLGVPKYSIPECQERGMTYAAPLRATLSLNVFKTEGEEKTFQEKITNDVYFGDIPLLTENGTFIVNGAERVVVSQLHRSPGVSFDEEFHPNGKRLLKARIIPYRGSWVEFLLDVNDAMYINIDRRRKLPATILLRAIGWTDAASILELFYPIAEKALAPELAGFVLAQDAITSEGEILAEANAVLTEALIENLQKAGLETIRIVDLDIDTDPVIHNTLDVDPTTGEEDALQKIYQVIRPGDPPNVETARTLIWRMFFDEKRYDLGEVGRYRMNSRLELEIEQQIRTMTKDDFLAIMRYLVGLFNGRMKDASGKEVVPYIDDIDHLGNRRARSVGELLSNQFAVAFTRMSRTIRERLSLRDTEEMTPQDLVNARTINAVIATFFGSSQLSQFMDQTNPLAELTHKRRLSALGPGGLTRERAGFEVRDVHHTHYGRLCPIETPEGPNIGLISSMSTYARVNAYGFIETPYRKVENGKVTGQIDYLTADKEDNFIIAPANTPVTEDGALRDEFVIARQQGEFPLLRRDEINYMDVSPRQLVSVAAGLIPFLEHDDANRALMGSNMQRQAVPLLRSEAPVVGTGLEARSALDSGSMILARNPGVVERVDASRVIVRRDKGEVREDDFLDMPEFDVYDMRKMRRSNQDTVINQKPIVDLGQRVEKGTPLADGASTDHGELALGKNILVSFLPWNGYNFEDAIIISEELLVKDTFTSIHIEEYELEVRDTKRGAEELTREIPNVGEDAIANLDELGVIRVGAEVNSGDILVGKVTPKGETELSPEERLLRAIFGEKANDVRDSSLKAPPGMKGIVIETRVFSRKEKDKKSKKADKDRIEKIKSELGLKIQEIREARDRKLGELLDGQVSGEVRDAATSEILVTAGKKWSKQLVARTSFDDVAISSKFCEDEALDAKISKIVETAQEMIRQHEDRLDKEIDKIVRGDELKPGVLQLVKVYIAKKRRLSVGDKMAGRHGNKGVISKIVPVEDMPYIEGGTPVQILLNPLGVPSRMNVGQILEVSLGWAAKTLGYKLATPVFDGATFEDIEVELEKAGIPQTGKVKLFDGRSGERLENSTTVGYMYMLKLGHLVDDKIHARSIGPYSLVTQQPLGGKSQFGGQRFGEMEVWALEAYGAAYTLQELLTVKSDDVVGRSKIYEAIVKGENAPKPGLPESFNVLIKEMQALALDVRFTPDGEAEA